MAFDPDKYLAEATPFNPDAYLGVAPRANIITSDVPTVVGQVPNPAPVEQPKRSMSEKLKALYEVPATIGSAVLSQPASMIYGLGRSVAEGVAQGKAPSPEARDMYYRQAREATQFQPTSPASADVLESMGGALEAAKIPPYIGNIGMIPSAMQASQVTRPLAQEARQAAQPAVNTMAQALRREPSIVKTAPSAEELAIKSNKLFDIAKDSGVEINSKEFSSNMKQIAKSLEDIGYDAELHPDIAIVVKRLTDPNVAKDFNKLKALRTMIGDLQGADTKLKRSIATNLKEDFDSYLATIPESSVTSGSKEGLAAWKDARDTYNRLSKSEVFTDMLENAQLDKSKFSMSGIENSLAQQLRQLAKNDKKMRLFTEDEQEAIKKAAKGGVGQNALRFVGKFAPTSAVSSIPALLATSVSGPVGLAATAASMGARVGATQMRKSDVNKLAALMRAGAKNE